MYIHIKYGKGQISGIDKIKYKPDPGNQIGK